MARCITWTAGAGRMDCLHERCARMTSNRRWQGAGCFCQGWLVYLCAAFALSFAVAWRPLRTFMIARLWLPVVLVSSLWAGALIFGFVASRASWSPIRVKPGYMRGTFLVAQRGWWGLYECMALFIYVVAGAFQPLMQLAVAVLHQYVPVSRLDLPTFSGHAGDDTSPEPPLDVAAPRTFAPSHGIERG